MTTIRNTCTDTARQRGLSQYMSQAEPIIAALEQREAQIVASLRNFATSAGLSPQEVNHALTQSGLDTQGGQQGRVTTPSDRGRSSDLQQTVNDLAREVSMLRQAAERNGISI